MHQRFPGQGLLYAGSTALIAACLHATPASATQVVLGRLDADALGAGKPISAQTDEWRGAAELRDLSAHATYQSPNSGIPSSEAHTFINAHWDSADSGSVNFTNEGVTVSQGDRLDTGILALYAATWEYRFIAEADGILDFDLKASFTGNDADIGRWRLGAADLFDPSQIVILDADGYPFGSDSLRLTGSLRLTAGRQYQFVLQNSGDSRNLEIPGFLQGNEAGTMTWSITPDAAPVPEPASWALMIAGFASAGAMLRARRRLNPA